VDALPVTTATLHDLFRWALILGLGFPLLMVALGELLLRLERRHHLLVAPLRIVRNFVLPITAVFLLLVEVLGWPETSGLVRVVETLLWICLIYAALQVVNILLFEDAKPGSWQAQVPKLFLDLSRFFLVLVGAAIVFSTVWGTDLGGVITALGVGSLVIGLALQDSLGNIFSGIALLFESPVGLGDWVEVDGIVGEVVNINWRSVHVKTTNNDLRVVPNSVLAQSSFTNFSRPEQAHFRTVEVGFSCDDAPNRVRQLLVETALTTKGVLPDPAPYVYTQEYGDFAIIYEVNLAFAGYAQSDDIISDFKTRLWYMAQRHRLTMPYPTEVHVQPEPPTFSTDPLVQTAATILKSIPTLAGLDADILNRLCQADHIQYFAADEPLLLQEQRVPGLFVLLTGTVEMIVQTPDGTSHALTRLGAGDVFGEESSLLGEQFSEVQIIAQGDVQVLFIEEALLESLVDQHPRFASELGELMQLRRQDLKGVKASKQEGSVPQLYTNRPVGEDIA
jgi:small-conductance mechanosensitive channel